MRHSRVFTFDLSPWLGSAREIGSTQASALWTLVTPPAAAAAAVARYLHSGCPPTLLPPSLDSTDTVSSFGRARRRRCRQLRLPSLAAVALGRSFRHRWPLPPPTLAALPGGATLLPTPIPDHHRWSLSPLPLDITPRPPR